MERWSLSRQHRGAEHRGSGASQDRGAAAMLGSRSRSRPQGAMKAAEIEPKRAPKLAGGFVGDQIDATNGRMPGKQRVCSMPYCYYLASFSLEEIGRAHV